MLKWRKLRSIQVVRNFWTDNFPVFSVARLKMKKRKKEIICKILFYHLLISMPEDVIALFTSSA